MSLLVRRPVAWAVLCIVCLTAGSAGAWNASGHMIIALVAYDQMNESARAAAVELIRAHPRFSDHFERAMPRSVERGDDREKDQWLFAYASTWPDVVRDARGAVDRNDVNRFHRSWWHFVNMPVFLSERDRQQMEHTLRVNLRRDPPADRDDPNMNVIQALKNSARIVQDGTADRGIRSVHVCWLLHLAGDSHQPLHSSALFTPNRFRRGDQGGNLLEIERNWSLHAFWDDQISTDRAYETVLVLAEVVGKNRELAAAGRRAAGTLDADAWLEESHELAKRYAYTDAVLKQVAEREQHTYLGPLELPAEYRADARAVSERRAVEAGYRLARLLEQLLK